MIIATCERVTEWVLKEVYQQLFYARVVLEGSVLKPNMVVSGKKNPKQASVAGGGGGDASRAQALRARRPSPASPSSPAASPISTPPPISTR